MDSLTSSISFHTHGDDGIIASDDETEVLCPTAEEFFRDNVVRTSRTRFDSAHKVQCKVHPVQLDQVIFPQKDQIS